MPQLGFSKGQPHSGPQRLEQKAHLGTLAPGLSSAVRALCRQQICCTDVKARTGGPTLPRRWEAWGSGASWKGQPVPWGPGRAAPGGGQPRMEHRHQQRKKLWFSQREELPKRAPSQFTKMEKEKINLLGCNLFWGSVFFFTGNLHAKETNPRGPVSAY